MMEYASKLADVGGAAFGIGTTMAGVYASGIFEPAAAVLITIGVPTCLYCLNRLSD
jgi:uncharacterized membrane protein YedE/YeeE